MNKVQRPRASGRSRHYRAAIAAAVGLAGVIAVPQAAGADEPTPIVCDTDNNTPGIDCDGTTVNLSTPDYGPGLTTIDPARVWDSRKANARLAAGGMVTVPIAGKVGVPTGATAVMANIAVVNPDGPGHITAYPCDATRPTTAMLTHIGSETRSGSTLVQLDTTGNLCLYSHAAADITVDIQGYIADSQNPATFTPIRLLDTRTGDGPVTGANFIVADTTELASVIDLTKPDEVAGVWLNVSTFLAEKPGWLGVDPYDLARSAKTARLNFEAGRAQTNLIFAPTPFGSFSVGASAATHMTIDVVGVSLHPDPLLPLEFDRVLDTRVGKSPSPGRLQPGVPREITIEGPDDGVAATAVLVNVAAVNPSAPTHVTVYPCEATVPTVANANAGTGTVISNAALVPVSAEGTICVVSVAETDLVVDLAAMGTSSPVGKYLSCFSVGAGLSVVSTVFGGAPPYTLTGTLPEQVTANYAEGQFSIVPSPDVELTMDRELLVTDSAGKSIPLLAQWNGGAPIYPPVC